MSDLIRRRAAIDAIRAMQTYKLFAGDDMVVIDQAGAQTELMMLPSAESERKTGRWILSDTQSKEELMNDNYLYYCSECGRYDIHSKRVEVPFCWHCGAEMEVSANE